MPGSSSRELVTMPHVSHLSRLSPWAAVIVSLLVGAMTLLVWDAITHQSSPIINVFPVKILNRINHKLCDITQSLCEITQF